MRTFGPGEGPEPQQISGRDRIAFPEYFALGFGQTGNRPRDRQLFCIEPIAYAGQDAIQGDIRRFKAALQGVEPQEAFLPAVAPGSIEHWLWNEHYSSTEEFLFAIADAMHQEYKAITDAGFLLQIDDPDLADAWQIHPELSIPEYRKFAALRIEALNHALRDIPQESIRLHVCWGSYHGPHRYDVPLKEIVDVILGVKAQGLLHRGVQPMPRARVEGLGGDQTARGQDAHPRRRGPQQRLRRAPRACGAAPGPLRQAGRQGECHGRDGLRPWHPRGPCQDSLGQVRVHGGRRPPGVEGALGLGTAAATVLRGTPAASAGSRRRAAPGP